MADGSIVIDTSIDSSGAVSQAESLGSSLRSTFGGLRDVMQGPIAAISLVKDGLEAVSAVMADLENEFVASEMGIAVLEQTLKATGAEAWTSSEALQDMAQRLQDITNIDKDLIIQSEAVLLGFKNIKGDQFEEATKAVLDMSAAMGMDLKSSATIVGKAINNDTEGLVALTRQGFAITDQQKEMWAAMIKAGNGAQVQSEILAKIEERYGGVAEAAGQVNSGSKRLEIAMGDLKEAGGKLVNDALNPIRNSLADTLVGATAGATAKFEEMRKEFARTGETSLSFAVRMQNLGQLLKSDDAYGKLTVEWLQQSAEHFGLSSVALAKLIITQGNFSDQAKKSAQAIIDLDAKNKSSVSGWEKAASAQKEYTKKLQASNTVKNESAVAVKKLSDDTVAAEKAVNTAVSRGLTTEKAALTEKINLRQKTIEKIDEEARKGTISAADAKKAVEEQVSAIKGYQTSLKNLNDQEDKAAETKKKNDATAKKNAEDLQEAVLAYKKSSVDGQIEIINAERQRLLALVTNEQERTAINQNASAQITALRTAEITRIKELEQDKANKQKELSDKRVADEQAANQKILESNTTIINGISQAISIMTSSGSKDLQELGQGFVALGNVMVQAMSGNVTMAAISWLLYMIQYVVDGINGISTAQENWNNTLSDAKDYVAELGKEFTGVWAEQDEALANSLDSINEYFDEAEADYQEMAGNKWASASERMTAIERVLELEALRIEAIAKAEAEAAQDKIDALEEYEDEWQDTQKTKLELIQDELDAELAKAQEMGASAATLAAIQEYYAKQAAEAQIEAAEEAAQASLDAMTDNAQAMYEAQQSFVESLGSLSTDLASELASNFEEGLTEADFLTTFKEKLLSMAIEGAIYAAGISDKLTALGESIKIAVAGGFTDAELTSLKEQATELYQQANDIINPIKTLIADIFPDTTDASTSTSASTVEDAVSSIEDTASSTASTATTTTDATSTYFTIECTIDGTAVGKAAFEYVDGVVKAAYGV